MTQLVTTYTDCNAFLREFDWVAELGLGSKTYGAGEVRTSNTVGIPNNLLWELIFALTSGGVTIEIFVSDVAGPNLGGGATFTTGAITDTVERCKDFATLDVASSGNGQYVTLRVTAGGGGAVMAKNELCAKDKMQVVHGVPQGYHEAVGGFNKVPATAGYVPMSLASAT